MPYMKLYLFLEAEFTFQSSSKQKCVVMQHRSRIVQDQWHEENQIQSPSPALSGTVSVGFGYIVATYGSIELSVAQKAFATSRFLSAPSKTLSLSYIQFE